MPLALSGSPNSVHYLLTKKMHMGIVWKIKVAVTCIYPGLVGHYLGQLSSPERRIHHGLRYHTFSILKGTPVQDAVTFAADSEDENSNAK